MYAFNDKFSMDTKYHDRGNFEVSFHKFYDVSDKMFCHYLGPMYIRIKMQFHKTNGPIVSFCCVSVLTKPFIQPFHHSKIKALAQGVLIR